MNIRLSENIRALRKERKMTQEQLAEALGVTVGAVHKWEARLSTPDISLILEMAALFETSTDVLLGYAWQSGRQGDALQSIARCREERRYDEGAAQAERALKKYPNCFEIVYESAQLYAQKGCAAQEKKVLRRALALYEHACELIAHSTEERVNEVAIRRQMANVLLDLGDADGCVALLKKYNVCGVNDAMIGMVLADCRHEAAEAEAYLARAFGNCLENLDALVMGCVNVFFQRGDYTTTLACMEWLRQTLRGGQAQEEITYFDKYDCVLLGLCAETCCMMGDVRRAGTYLAQAVRLAARYDAAKSIGETRLFAQMGVKNQPNYDSYGATAMEALERRVATDAELVTQLPALLEQAKKEVLGDAAV